MSLADFQTSQKEKSSNFEFQEEINAKNLMLMRLSMHNRSPQDIFGGIQHYFSTTWPIHTQKSNVKYHRIMDAIADTKHTMMAMLHDLHDQYTNQQKP